MTLPSDETEVPQTNDSQSNPLFFFDVQTHVFLQHVSCLTSWGGVKPMMSDHFSRKNVPVLNHHPRFLHSLKVYSPTPPRQTSPASWASKFAWYRHSPPLAPYGSTNYARSCNAPHLGLGGEGGVLLTWQQGHQLPKSQNAGTKKKPKDLATFPWVCRHHSLYFLKNHWFLGMLKLCHSK